MWCISDIFFRENVSFVTETVKITLCQESWHFFKLTPFVSQTCFIFIDIQFIPVKTDPTHGHLFY